ncbi:hypothetical protein L226DRAFT_554064 [Lentinus tigrinus ALCF2SS1-7]|uniref:Uncharacterized protein n=1 Tax=Lentinus tigrinus ALCF2SS1-6 TaxID=1328759 RepID=A0A5C2RWX0_9APHY|nr:hypothetical protein L227DRAFT_656853 [Lentinus tigrinus ALCF2SS1-6]RPD72611.1 hypothetical protein L226DRAFT_554064 [Lentinus tigrinus ALCF2SS1-7]
MAHVQFSWSDSIQATLSSCLPCFKSTDASDDEHEHQRPRNPAFAHAVPPPRARPDELEGLLADASDDADALSLHTNPGERRRKKKQKRRGAPKHIRVFGFDLFGRAPAIQLPESDDEDPLVVGRRRSGSGSRAGRAGGRGGMGSDGRTISSSSMDSDAAPLDAAAIEALSAARQAEARAREEEARREKEERRRRRRERRELKKAAMAAALDVHANGDHEFEGFQGSGPALPHLTSPFTSSLTSGTGSGSTSSHEFGPFAHGQPVQPFDPDAAEAAEAEAADGADFGGESYTSRPRKSLGGGGGGTMSTSDTRSSSSRGTSVNGFAGPAPYNHQFLAQHQPSVHSPLSESVPSSPLSPTAPTAERKKRRKSKSKGISISHSTSSQSATASSLMSPPPTVPEHLPAIAGSAADDFEGFPGDLGSSGLVATGGAEHVHEEQQQPRKPEPLPVSGFPSVGLRGTGRRNSDMGVFLARRGDE